jgi:hypothetical protein
VGDEGVLLLAVALRGRFVACDVYGLQLPAPAAESRSKNWGKQMVRECGRVRHQLHLGTRNQFFNCFRFSASFVLCALRFLSSFFSDGGLLLLRRVVGVRFPRGGAALVPGGARRCAAAAAVG